MRALSVGGTGWRVLPPAASIAPHHSWSLLVWRNPPDAHLAFSVQAAGTVALQLLILQRVYALKQFLGCRGLGPFSRRAPLKGPLGPDRGWEERVLSPAAGGDRGTVCVVVWVGWGPCVCGGSAGRVKPEVFTKGFLLGAGRERFQKWLWVNKW